MIRVGEEIQIDAARKDLVEKAKSFFAKQYLKQNADGLQVIFTQVESFVNTKPIYVQIQTRRYAIMALAFGWPAVQDTSSNIGKARYLETLQSIVAIYG